MTTNIVRRTERGGTSQQAAASVLMENELGVLTDVKKLIVGDGNKAGGYTLTPDNVVAVWPDQAEASSPLSLAWWINRADGSAVKLRLPAGTYNVLNDLTVPANVYLEIDNGAVFNVAAGKTLTLDCEVDMWTVTNTGGGTLVDNAGRSRVPGENLIRHNVSCWERGRMCVTESEGPVGSDYNRDNLKFAALRYRRKIPVTAGGTYTIKAWGSAGCRLFFYREAERQPAPAHLEHYEDIDISDDECVGRLLETSSSAAVELLQKGYTFTVPAEATYMRLYSYVLNDSGSVMAASIFDLGDKHLFKLEKGRFPTAFTPNPKDCNAINAYSILSNERPLNDPVAARQLVSCMESYAGRSWVYGRSHIEENNDSLEMNFKGPADDGLYTVSAYSGGSPSACEKSCDCGAPIFLAIRGIPYWQSRYEQLTNRWRGTHFYPWGKYVDNLRASSSIEWLYKNGWAIDPGINYSKLQAGDLVFWRTNPYKPEYPSFKNLFRMWDHVAMFTGRWVESTPTDAADGRLHPECIESGGYGPTLTVGPDGKAVKENLIMRRFLDRINPYDAEHGTSTSSSSALECMFARVPLESPYSEYNSADGRRNTLEEAVLRDSDAVIYSASYRPSVYVSGKVSDGDLRIDVYNGMNAAVWEIGGINGSTGMETENPKRVRSGFMPASWKVQNYIDTTDLSDWTQSMTTRFSLITRYFYDGALNPISGLISSRQGVIPEGAKYVRYCYGILNEAGDFTSHELAGFNFFVAVQPDVTKTVGAIVSGQVKVTGQAKPRLAYDAVKAYYDGSSSTVAKYRAFSQGYHSYAHIALSELPLGSAQSYSIGSKNGVYSVTVDGGITWTPLPQALREKLENLRIADGENFIYIPNGQNVILSRAVV